MSQPGPPSPKLSDTQPLGKGSVGGDKPQGASEEEQRPDFFASKGEDYKKTEKGSSDESASAASGSADALTNKADEDKASRTNP
ncbi:hypothetical protein [Phaffia rhodozyma]|uniref:Uncharacterized protein n=1 Tax=Phaffia rhodozyma TaxID=264483 RepID=A0A0F7SNA0_PHARH|nr:hypothetical protein [Phaffia rhodozyma]